MPNFEDVLIDAGETPEASYPCIVCLQQRPPFMLDEDRKCSSCHIEEAREHETISLDQLKEAKRATITLWRNERDDGGAQTPLGIMDTDSVSIVKITGAVQLAQIAMAAGEPFSIMWTMKDNTSVEHDAQQMIQAGVMVGQHIASNHAVSVGLKAQVDAAETAEELDLIVWPDP